ncbi:MAG: T9SS type A sorting domain-containing protein [Candidatus Latescibacterota bacterium]
MELNHTILIDSVASGVTEYVDLFVPVNGVPYTYWLDAVAANGGMSAKIVARFVQTAVGEEATVSLPQEYFLYQNSPNPFNPTTVIRYQLPTDSHVEIVVYDVLGRKVQVLADGLEAADYRSVVWDGRDDLGRKAGSGVYLVRMQAKDFVEVRKMALIR